MLDAAYAGARRRPSGRRGSPEPGPVSRHGSRRSSRGWMRWARVPRAGADGTRRGALVLEDRIAVTIAPRSPHHRPLHDGRAGLRRPRPGTPARRAPPHPAPVTVSARASWRMAASVRSRGRGFPRDWMEPVAASRHSCGGSHLLVFRGGRFRSADDVGQGVPSRVGTVPDIRTPPAGRAS